jgi:hypothetical protein
MTIDLNLPNSENFLTEKGELAVSVRDNFIFNLALLSIAITCVVPKKSKVEILTCDAKNEDFFSWTN